MLPNGSNSSRTAELGSRKGCMYKTNVASVTDIRLPHSLVLFVGTMSKTFAASLAFLAILTFIGETGASKRQAYCNLKCQHLVDRLTLLKKKDLESYSLWSKVGANLRIFCKRARLSSPKCTEFFGYALQNAGKGRSSLSICKASAVCHFKSKTSDSNEARDRLVKPTQGCKVCNFLKSTLQSVGINQQAKLWKHFASQACNDKHIKGTRSACNFLERNFMSPDKLLSTILGLGGASCEKFLCNKASTEVLKFLPKSAGSCKLCHQVLNISLDALKSSEKILDAVLSDVNAVCMNIENKTLKAACDESIKKTREIFNYVLKQLELTNLCEDLGFCPGNKEDEPFFQVAKSFLTTKPASCEGCKHIERISKGASTLQSNMSVMKGYFDQACQHSQNENLKTKCVLARPLVKIASDTNILNTENCAALMCSDAAQVLKSLFLASERGCEICKATVKIMAESKDQAVILVKQILNDVDVEICSSLATAEGRKACYYSTNETLKIFSYVLSKLDISNVCTDFGFCTKNMKTKPLDISFSGLGKFLAAIASDKPSGSKSCNLCDSVSRKVKAVKTLVKIQLSKLSVIKGSCKDARSKKCVEWQEILARFNNIQGLSQLENVCKTFGCNSFVSRLINKIPRGERTCSICKMSLRITMDGIKQGVAFADQIIEEAGTLCNDYQTEEAQKKCRSVIAETKVILNYVMKRLPLNNLCEELDLCP